MRQRLIIIVYLMLSLSTFAQINIWEGEAGRPKVGMAAFPAQKSRHVAIIVCPGGSYFWHDTETEGDKVAHWLQENGITAFVLDYRTAYVPAFITHFRYIFRGNRYPDPQDDLRQAIRYVKSHAKEYNIDPDKIGAMGFSAGGHLVMSSVELFEKDDWPAFVVPVYPVVTMTASCVHKRSRRGLLGDSRVRNKELRELLSLEKHVPSDCPPVFLINCKDDPIVDYHNSILLDSALTSQKISHQYLLYETGGHGFGASDIKGTPECRQWKEEFIKWINKILKI